MSRSNCHLFIYLFLLLGYKTKREMKSNLCNKIPSDLKFALQVDPTGSRQNSLKSRCPWTFRSHWKYVAAFYLLQETKYLNLPPCTILISPRLTQCTFLSNKEQTSHYRNLPKWGTFSYSHELSEIYQRYEGYVSITNHCYKRF